VPCIQIEIEIGTGLETIDQGEVKERSKSQILIGTGLGTRDQGEVKKRPGERGRGEGLRN